ncbi:uncharacterized protein LOC103308325 [Acyrthosiphon pisum]|uniref:Integrase catalytic domain-containing protein n=1 Tax=Acyrthosiphon pisum TaxID=7029 RepID=A0A8R1X1H3_ACYPI|nr:uncharacterized protein LOC103308325 [Acyrthosiphon pisum]|eukprot:XP_008179733.1 PREDICTED: uncharacterized protein LOC103308325 [Acyrthosiphon pisum]
MTAKLITKRGQLKGVLTRFWTYVSADDSDVEQILVRKEKIEEVWQEFNQVQAELEMDDQNDGDELYNYRAEFEESYFKAVATANKKIQHEQNSVRTISQQEDSTLMTDDRIKKTSELGLCKICLRRHDKKKCLARYCFKCGKPHNTMLHLGPEQQKTASPVETKKDKDVIETPVSASSTSSINAHAATSTEQVLLTTAIVLAANVNGNMIPCRALLDSGSQTNFITEELAQTLKLKKAQSIFFDILCEGKIRTNPNGPLYQKTQFGWVASGLVAENHRENAMITSSTFFTTENGPTVEKLLQKFWFIEEPRNNVTHTREEQVCVEHFNNTVTRCKEDGRFIVQLPLHGSSKRLGKSYEIAKRRLLAMERKFENNRHLKLEYTRFMKEYEELGHMELVKDEVDEIEGETCYLPHHAVRKEDSTSTKLRVVFDASCKTQTGVSLNDILLKGPVIQDDIIYILARFRTHRYVLSADVEKMYRQIWVSEEHRDMQRILWRATPDMPIQTYRLNTVTYGTITASYLATACFKRLAEIYQNQYREAATVIVRDFYMDDFLGGAESKEKAAELLTQLIALLGAAGMKLRKWSSNDIDLVKSIVPEEDIELSNDFETEGAVKKILGLFWDASSDTLRFKVPPVPSCAKNTVSKRKILSDIASIFDPLGLVGPVVIRARILLQALWREKIDWDEAIPAYMQEEWRKYCESMSALSNLSIPRKIAGDLTNKEIEVHGFSDASELAYGCCLYVRCTNSVGIYYTSLICAKSKVAPIKSLSIPRLELCAALLLVRVATTLLPKLQINIQRRYFWTDSTIVLSWIASQSAKWKTFVANRVSEIQENTLQSEWHHVKSSDNPADVISRGCCASKLAQNELWWSGPAWLRQNEREWPAPSWNMLPDEFDVNNSVAEMKKNETFTLVATEADETILHRFSSLSKCIRITAWCLRLKNNTLLKNEKISGSLSVSELDNAKTTLIKMVQAVNFANELRELKNSNRVLPKSKLLRLRPFLDENNLIRVGGRLKNASLIDIQHRHPIVLPADSMFTKLLCRDQHERLMHGGPQAVLAAIRLKYWPINGRNLIRNIIHKCIVCFRSKPITVQPIMGNLPSDRVEPGRPFLKCGVDFAGPFFIKSSLLRRAPLIKSYACVFVCFATKAVHIELVNDLTTQSFINALNRFFDRRGKSSVIYSDNATNFVGANNKLKELRQLFQSELHLNSTKKALADVGVSWHFIPPRSPHFGGLWEAAVKSMKSLLVKVLGNVNLTFEELATLLTRAEACLNSRPLTPLSSDPSDPTCITPAHFLVGDSLVAIPEPNLLDVPINRLTRWRRVTQCSQLLWRRWSTEYLGQLQERAKWSSEKGPGIRLGSVVLIKEDNIPALQWRLGVIVSTPQGDDGIIRVAQVKTAEGTYKRAVRQLCPLPFEGNTD